MPARKPRSGAELEAWEAKKERYRQSLILARTTVRELSGHALLRQREVAEMLLVSTKTLREMEKRGELPPRVTLNPGLFGWRLKDIEELIDSRREAA